MKCKRLIDECRMEWLVDQGLQSELALYVPGDVSPENMLLSAVPPKARGLLFWENSVENEQRRVNCIKPI